MISPDVHRGGKGRPESIARRARGPRAVMSNDTRLCASSRIMLAIQKNDAMRAPEVTGVTRCKLDAALKNQIARRALDGVRAVRVFDHEVSALVAFRITEEQRR